MTTLRQKLGITAGIAALVLATTACNTVALPTPKPEPKPIGTDSAIFDMRQGMSCYKLWERSGAERNGVSYPNFLEQLEIYNSPISKGIQVDADEEECDLWACPTSARTLDGQPIYDCESEQSPWRVYWPIYDLSRILLLPLF